VLLSVAPLVGGGQSVNVDVAEAVAKSVLDPSPRPEAEYLLLKAKDAAYFGEYEKALKLVNRSIQISNKIMEAHLIGGNLLLELDKGKRALRYYQRALKLGGESVNLFLKIGSAYMALGRHDVAEDYFTKAVQLGPNHVSAYVKRGEARIETGKLDLALSDFNKAIQLDATSAAARRGLGRTYMEQGNYRIALEHLDKAVDMSPGDADSWYYRGMANFRSFRLVAACQDFTKALELGHRRAKAMMGETCS
jgi:tetratricopeptide (TPR) repeat protein